MLDIDVISTAQFIVTWVAISAMVFGGVVPYIPQYRKIWRTQDAQGFSTFVCLVLLIANVLRITFWFVKRFEWPLLVQSIIMIVAMLMLLHLCVRVNYEKDNVMVVHRRFLDFNFQHFWNWTQFSDYCQCILCISLLGFAVTYILRQFIIYVELLGFASVLTEAMLGVPQFWKNFKNRSTQGMSPMMIICWTTGDLFKTGYFLVRQAPMQFWICGMLQVLVDVSILIQIVVYRRQTPPTPSHHSKFTKLSVT